jgi:hypothetical protein
MIVLVALVAAGFSAPRWFKTRANAGRDSQTNGVAPVQPATPAVVETPSAPKAAGTKRAVSQPAGDQTVGIQAAKEPPRPDPARLAELDHEMDQISSREAAANASLDSFQRAQSAQGLQLRGDIVAAQQRMQVYAAKAQSALQAQDVENTRKYLDLMETELGKIEKFLGHWGGESDVEGRLYVGSAMAVEAGGWDGL